MSGRSAFALLALALFGVGFTIYAVIASTPFFPKALQTEFGVCPASHDYPAERRPVIEDYEAEWYSSSLLGLHEEPLFEDEDKARQTVRFTFCEASTSRSPSEPRRWRMGAFASPRHGRLATTVARPPRAFVAWTESSVRQNRRAWPPPRGFS